MECLLSITSVVDIGNAQGRKLWGKIVHVTAEAELDQHYSEFGFTTSIDGKLIQRSFWSKSSISSLTLACKSFSGDEIIRSRILKKMGHSGFA